MVRAITILFVLMTASVVQAQVLAVRTTERSCDANSCRTFYGTGTCSYIGNADGKSVYITAAHVVSGAAKVEVGYAGKWWGAIIKHQEQRYDEATSQNIDFAIIETRQIPSNKCMSLGSVFPESGVRATAYGYSGGIYNLRGLPSKIYIRNNLRGVRDPVKKGDSGGPVVVDGKIVGVISSVVEDGKMTLCTPANLVRMQLKRSYKTFPCCDCRPVARVIPVQPIQPKPDPLIIDNSDEIAALEGQIERLRADLDAMRNTQIPVWILNKEKEPVAKQSYKFGDPIKLRVFPKEKKGSDAQQEQTIDAVK